MTPMETPKYELRFIKNIEREIKTPAGLFDKGMYACSSCGGLNAIENEKCKKCGAAKFVIR